MLAIVKGGQAPCLVALQNTAGADWSTVTAIQKQEIMAYLAKEQRGLCAYCMSRIGADGSVDHWQARAAGGAIFGWSNLLAVCRGGGAGAALADAHCDRRKQARALSFNPASRGTGVESMLKFLGNGRVELVAGAPRNELIDEDGKQSVLNLNHPDLVSNRSSVVDLVLSVQDVPKRVKAGLALYSSPQGDLPAYALVGRKYFRMAAARLRGLKRMT